MRATARRRLTSLAAILRATTIETETGSRIDYLPVASSVPAGLRDPTVGAELLLAGRVQSSSVVTVLLPLFDDAGAAVTVRAADRVSVTVDRAGVSGTTLAEVLGVVGGTLSDQPILQRAVCQVIA